MADDWQLPAAVAEYFAELDAAGKREIDAADWWAAAKADPSWEPDPAVDHRQANPMHFVQGRASPCRGALSGRLSDLRVFHSESVSCGAFV